MKLKKLLKQLDEWSQLIIWDQVGTTEEKWEVVFEGGVFDVPWMYADRHLIKAEDNDGSLPVCAFHKEDGTYGIRITLADEERK